MIIFSLLYIFAVFIASLAQILLKISARKEHKNQILEYINKDTITAYFLLFVSSFLVVIAFRKVPLKSGPIFEAAGYIFVFILSKFILNEKITHKKIAGIIIIITGIIVFNI